MEQSTRAEQLREQCVQFHAKHPEVWNYFCDFTFDRIRRGLKHYSADAVMHRVRWETDAGNAEGLKINNNFVAFYARRFMRAFPEYDGFFRLRRQTSNGRKPKTSLWDEG